MMQAPACDCKGLTYAARSSAVHLPCACLYSGSVTSAVHPDAAHTGWPACMHAGCTCHACTHGLTCLPHLLKLVACLPARPHYTPPADSTHACLPSPPPHPHPNSPLHFQLTPTCLPYPSSGTATAGTTALNSRDWAWVCPWPGFMPTSWGAACCGAALAGSPL